MQWLYIFISFFRIISFIYKQLIRFDIFRLLVWTFFPYLLLILFLIVFFLLLLLGKLYLFDLLNFFIVFGFWSWSGLRFLVLLTFLWHVDCTNFFCLLGLFSFGVIIVELFLEFGLFAPSGLLIIWKLVHILGAYILGTFSIR